jgi:hypothetical protein
VIDRDWLVDLFRIGYKRITGGLIFRLPVRDLRAQNFNLVINYFRSKADFGESLLIKSSLIYLMLKGRSYLHRCFRGLLNIPNRGFYLRIYIGFLFVGVALIGRALDFSKTLPKALGLFI